MPSSTQAENVLRSSYEYAAAFDIEVWKAQQQAFFHQQLSKAKKKMEEKIRQSVHAEQEKIFLELESTRKELSRAAAALQETEKELLKRGAALDAREKTMETNRQRSATQLEEQRSHWESALRREKELHKVVVDALEQQVHEKEQEMRALMERLRTVEASFELLRRRVNHALPHVHSTDGGVYESAHSGVMDSDVDEAKEASRAQLQRVKNDLAVADSTIKELTQSVMRLQDEQREREKELANQRSIVQHREQQALRLARKCQSLQTELQEKEKAYLREKEEEIRARERALEVQQGELLRASGSSAPRLVHSFPVSSSEVLGMHARKGAEIGPRGGSSGGFLDLISSLRQELRDRCRLADASEVPPSALMATPQRVDQRESSKPRVVLAEPLQTENRTSEESDGSSDINVAVPDLFEEASLASPPSIPRQPAQRSPATDDSSDHSHGQGGLVGSVSSSGAGRVSSAFFDHRLPPSHSSFMNGGAASHRSEAHVASPSGAVLEPSPYSSMVQPTHSGAVQPVYPLPEDFNQAGDISSNEAKTTREEMRQFVEQLKSNRQRLLDTKVYSEDHPVLQEMSAKLELYNAYLQETSAKP